MTIRLIHVNERRISLSEFDSSCMEEVLEQVRIQAYMSLLVLQVSAKRL